MKENNTIGHDAAINDAISQLRHLSELQTEIAVNEAAARDEAGGTAPATQPASPDPKQQLLDRMIKERESKMGPVSYSEKKAMEKYIDAKVSALGPGATVDSLAPTEKDQMVGYIKNVNEDMLYKREDMDRVTLGPVQRAVQTVPFITTPDYPPEPQPPEQPKPDHRPTNEEKPVEPAKPTSWEIKQEMLRQVAAGHNPLEAAELAKQICNDKYEQSMAQYNDDLQKWKDDRLLWDKWEDYEEKHDEWLEETKKLDKQADNVEKALALGLMKTDYNPETGKYAIAYQTGDGTWVKQEFDDAGAAKAFAMADPKEPPINPAAMAVEVNPDLLAAIATGDIMVQPAADGKTLDVIRNDNSPDNKNPGVPTPLLLDNQEAKDQFSTMMNGYQDKTGVKYDDIDGRAYRNAEQKKEALTNASTNEAGVKICPACKQPLKGAAAQAKGIDQLAIVPRSASLLARKLQYRAGYVAWEKVDAAVQLTKASLVATKSNKLTSGQVSGLVKYISSMLGNKQDLAVKFIERLSSSTTPSIINPDNVDIITHAISHQYSSEDVHEMLARGRNCPLCGEAYPTPTLPLTGELTKAQTNFKGPKLINEWAANNAGKPYVPMQGVAELLRDGTQQAFNPFTDIKATWTKFSYRPTDAEEGYPIISIIPASFQGMANINVILNTTPYVVVSEYFMRNNVSSAVNLFQGALEGKADAPSSEEANEPSAIKDATMQLTNLIKNGFKELAQPAKQAIHMPFVLYHRLKAKLYGNRYIFPYNPRDNAISTSSNTEEWGDGGGILSTLTSGIMGAVSGLTGFLGFGVAKPFPAPTWKLPESGAKWTFNFQLNLINDEYVRTRNNYMCANTLINNNRWIQKTLFGFPGALYEVLVPTGTRELMCTGNFSLKPLGVNRHVPFGFFDVPFKIGSQVYPTGKADLHSDAYEVVPDAYTLDCTFTSAITENLNNSVFGYYLPIADFAPGTPTASALETTEAPSPWAAAAIVEEKTDDAVALEQAAIGLMNTANNLLDQEAAKAIAEEEKKNKDDGGEGNPPEGGDGGGGGGGTSSAPAPKRRARSMLRWDSTVEMYTNQHDTLRKKLSIVNDEIKEKQKTLQDLLLKSEDLPLTNIRKTYSKRIAKIRKELESLLKKSEELENNLIQTEIALLVRAKDKVEERTTSEVLAVPRGYFDPYEVDELTKLKIKLMTRDELDKFIAEQEAHLCAIDKWGIHNCRDFRIRVGVMQFIAEAMGELEDLIRDAYELDTEAYDKYRYRYEMLKNDLSAALDPSTPFILNRTNLIYIPQENIPQELLNTVTPTATPLLTQAEQEDQSTETLPQTTDSGEEETLPAITQTEDGSLIVDRKELIKQHRAEVIKQVFGNEEGLAAAAFKSAVEHEANPSARYDRDVLVKLKRSPDLDDQPSIYEWLHTQSGEAYSDVAARFASGGDDAILDKDLSPEERAEILAHLTRSQAIFYVTQDLYRYVHAHRMVLLGNAMDTVNTKSTAVLNRVMDDFQRLEN